MFRAIIFAVVDCGYSPRSALELVDSGDIRLHKIENLIESSKYGIHDLSNMDLDKDSKLPRFNMPLELGIFLGAKRYGDKTQKKKRILVLDKERYRYQKSISDISGQDIKSHGGKEERAIKCIRDWLQTASRRTTLPGARHITNRYRGFEKELPVICATLKLDVDDLTFNDLWETIVAWQKENV